jgi:hypothetical protein
MLVIIVSISILSVDIFANSKEVKINYFKADKSQVNSGDSVILSWDVTNAKDVSFTGTDLNIQNNLPNKGNMQVWPMKDSTYKLSVRGYDGRSSFLTVDVKTKKIAELSTTFGTLPHYAGDQQLYESIFNYSKSNNFNFGKTFEKMKTYNSLKVTRGLTIKSIKQYLSYENNINELVNCITRKRPFTETAKNDLSNFFKTSIKSLKASPNCSQHYVSIISNECGDIMYMQVIRRDNNMNLATIHGKKSISTN